MGARCGQAPVHGMRRVLSRSAESKLVLDQAPTVTSQTDCRTAVVAKDPG